jgi:hypothetical protein
MGQVSIAIAIAMPPTSGFFFNYADVALIPNWTYIRLMWGFPAIFLLLQIVLMLTVFRIDTPHELKHWGRHKELREVISKLYAESEIDVRISEIEVPTTDAEDFDSTSSLLGTGTVVIKPQ